MMVSNILIAITIAFVFGFVLGSVVTGKSDDTHERMKHK